MKIITVKNPAGTLFHQGQDKNLLQYDTTSFEIQKIKPEKKNTLNNLPNTDRLSIHFIKRSLKRLTYIIRIAFGHSLSFSIIAILSISSLVRGSSSFSVLSSPSVFFSSSFSFSPFISISPNEKSHF